MCGENDNKDRGLKCPLCAAWERYHHSKLAGHVRGIEREGLMAVRSVLDWAIDRCERFGGERKES